MKKTLVALAVLAASGASFAQATITGEYAFGYIQSKDNAGVGSGGFGTDTSQLWFKNSEDLGGGYKAAASMSLAGADRSGESTSTAGQTSNGGVTGRDAELTLTTPVGVLALGTKRNADWLNTQTPDGTWSALDGFVRSGRTRRDQATFAVPYGAFTFAVTSQEGANHLGEGAGAEGAATAGTTTAVANQRLTGFVAKYAGGAARAEAQYLIYDQNVGGAKNTIRLGGGYDLGMVNVGAAIQITDLDFTGGAAMSRVTDTQVGVSVPFGAFTLGAVWAQNKVDDGPLAGTKAAYSLQGTYNLSKTTYVIGAFKRGETAVGKDSANRSMLLLVKDF